MENADFGGLGGPGGPRNPSRRPAARPNKKNTTKICYGADLWTPETRYWEALGAAVPKPGPVGVDAISEGSVYHAKMRNNHRAT